MRCPIQRDVAMLRLYMFSGKKDLALSVGILRINQFYPKCLKAF
jgi:hypothetical protein